MGTNCLTGGIPSLRVEAPNSFGQRQVKPGPEGEFQPSGNAIVWLAVGGLEDENLVARASP